MLAPTIMSTQTNSNSFFKDWTGHMVAFHSFYKYKLQDLKAGYWKLRFRIKLNESGSTNNAKPATLTMHYCCLRKTGKKNWIRFMLLSDLQCQYERPDLNLSKLKWRRNFPEYNNKILPKRKIIWPNFWVIMKSGYQKINWRATAFWFSYTTQFCSLKEEADSSKLKLRTIGSFIYQIR
jgi:hypothetical protein